MIVVCPACDTRYLVDDAALAGPAGRRVRCANCGHAWQQKPERVEPSVDVAPSPAAGEDVAPAAEQPAEPQPPASGALVVQELRLDPMTKAEGPTAMSRPGRDEETRHRSWGRSLAPAIIAALLIFVIGLGVIAVRARDNIIAMWPATAPVYAALHLGVAPPGAGLEVTVTPTRTPDSVVISGAIVNSTKVPRPVPRIRVSLRDGSAGDLASKIIEPPVATLQPGASARFNTTFEHPSVAATRADVSFVTN